MEIDDDFNKMNIKSPEDGDTSMPMDSQDSSNTQVSSLIVLLLSSSFLGSELKC